MLSSGTLTLTDGAAGSVNTVTVNSVGILDTAVPFKTSLTQTAADLAAAINNSTSSPEYSATSAGAVVTITAQRETGAGPNGYAVAATAIATSTTAIAGGVLVKHPTQVWAGVAVATDTAGWFRFIGSVADTGVIDSTESQVRIDGTVATSGGQVKISSTAITSGATQAIGSFPLPLPSS